MNYINIDHSNEGAGAFIAQHFFFFGTLRNPAKQKVLKVDDRLIKIHTAKLPGWIAQEDSLNIFFTGNKKDFVVVDLYKTTGTMKDSEEALRTYETNFKLDRYERIFGAELGYHTVIFDVIINDEIYDGVKTYIQLDATLNPDKPVINTFIKDENTSDLPIIEFNN